MNSEGIIEPGILPTFRLLVTVELLLSAVGLVGHWFAPFRAGIEIITLTTYSVVELGVLLVYLSASRLRQWLGRMYLPIGVLMATFGPMLDPYLQLHIARGYAPDVLTELILWRQIILLFTPLIVISWQYGIRQVALFCGITTAINIGLLTWTIGINEMIERSLMGTLLTESAVFFLVGHMILNLMLVQREQRKKLTDYASTLEQLTISRERNRLAREMHDVLAHTLSGVAIELEGVRTTLRHDPEQAAVLVDHSLKAVREGLGETRRAIQAMRARPLEDLGLSVALEALAETFDRRGELRVEVNIDAELGEYSPVVQQCIYRTAQEALTNAASHAGAQTAWLDLHRENRHLRLTVRDDGRGFDPDAMAGGRGLGLLGMRERAEMAGGKWSVESAPGKGTRVTLSMEVADVQQPARTAGAPVDL